MFLRQCYSGRGMLFGILLCTLIPFAFPSIGRPRSPLQPIFNVKSFGAKGDAISDDTAFVTAASRAAATAGGNLVFPVGIYVFNPARSKIIVGSNMTISGPGTIKVKAQAGNYQYLIGAPDPRIPIDNVTLEGLKIDQNAEGNTSSVISNSDQKSLQCIFLSWNVRKLVVRNCTFDASGVNTIVANGDNVEEARFENNSVIFHKRPGQPSFDNSAFYFAGANGIFKSNRCRAALSAAARTCIEVHNGNLSINDNFIEGYTIGMNIVDPADASVSNNTGVAVENGIFLWATSDHVARNVEILDNNFSINNVDRQSSESAGIASYYGYKMTGTLDQITIRNNKVIFQPERVPRFVNHPRSNWGISTQAFGPVKNVLIVGNYIENAPVRAIKIGQRIDEPFSEPPQTNIWIERNSVLNAGYNSDRSVAPYRAAIAAEGKLTNITIRDNTIAESSVSPGVFTIWFGDRIGPYQDVKCYGQRIIKGGRGVLELIPPEVKRSSN